METKFYCIGFVYQVFPEDDGTYTYTGHYFNTVENSCVIYPGNEFNWNRESYTEFRQCLEAEVIRFIEPPEKYHFTWVEMYIS